jgi:hypothetical protein
MKNFLDFHFPDDSSTKQARDRFGLTVEDVQAVKNLHNGVQRAVLKIFGTKDQRDLLRMGSEFDSRKKAYLTRKHATLLNASGSFYFAYVYDGGGTALHPEEVMDLVDELAEKTDWETCRAALDLLARLKKIPGMRTDSKHLQSAVHVLKDQGMRSKELELLIRFTALNKFENLDDFIRLVELFGQITNELAFVSSGAIASITETCSIHQNLSQKIDFAAQLFIWAYDYKSESYFVGQNMLVILDLASGVYLKGQFSFEGLQSRIDAFLQDHGSEAVEKLRGVLEGGNIPSTFTGLETNMDIALALLERKNNPKRPILKKVAG